MDETRRMPLWITLLCLLPGVGYLAAFFGMPLMRVLWGSVRVDTAATGAPPGFTLEHWARLFGDRVFLDGVGFSIWLGIAPTVVSLLIALPLAALIQANARAQRLARTIYRIPLVVPGIIAGFMVLVIFDLGGTAYRIADLFGLPMPRLVRDEWAIGVIIASCWKTIPFMTLIIAGSMAAINPEVLSAARTLGAGRLTVLARIQAPLSRPGISAAVLLSFIGSLGSFVVPRLLGPSYPLPLSIHMYEQGFQEGHWNMVYAMGALLSFVSIAILLAYYAALGGMARLQAAREGKPE